MPDEDDKTGSETLARPEEEASRLQALAVENYASGNLKAAAKHAKRAHKLHPSLSGLPEMLAAFKILGTAASPVMEAENSILDYYKILGVEEFSHINTIKKRYKTLAMTLHPDKNSFAASEEAFKLVGEAVRVLSDKTRRKEYDTKLRIALQSKACQESGFTAETFWTACSTCRLLHQFERKYLEHNLMCPRCKKTFKAMEVVEDGNHGGNSVAVAQTLRVSARIRDRVERGENLGMKRKIDSVAERLKMEVEDDFLLKDLVKKVKKVVELEEDGGSGGEEVESERTKRAKAREEGTMTLSQMQILAKKKKKIDAKKLYENRREKDEVGSEKEREFEKKENGRVNEREKRERRRVSKYGNLEQKSSKKNGYIEVMQVEDSDFHDFDKERTARTFKKGQIWAVYDDQDGMPRDYALINEVISVSPFEVTLSWLQVHGNGQKRGLGIFNVSNKVSIKYLNLFSHVVDCERVAREVYHIYPKKGSIWGMYSDSRNRINVVVCLRSYSDVHGLSIGYLEKVSGFRTVFRRRAVGVDGVVCLGKDGVNQFSHRIPAKKLLGEECSRICGDCWELDPAAIPNDFLGEC